MGFLRRLGNSGPYMGSPKNLHNPRSDLLKQATYQIVAGPRGTPAAQLGLVFDRRMPACTNPEMTLAVLIDRSGSMRETYREGHVDNAAAAILAHVAQANAGFDLVFYDDQVSYVGHISSPTALRQAVAANGPRGGTYVAEAIRGTIERYRKRQGIYLIVITDGEFADKNHVQSLVVDTLLPQMTPETPYAFRLHFVGAGEGVDRAFLQQLEDAATGKGVPLVTQHHHAHLSHSHNSILDELDRSFVGVGTQIQVGDSAQSGQVVTRFGDVTTGQWHDSGGPPLPFLPRRVLLGFEFTAPHPHSLPVALRYLDAQGSATTVDLDVPLPADTTAAAVAAQAAPTAPQGRHWHLPWRHSSPEQEAARAEAERQRAELAQRIVAVRQAEVQRQAADLQALGRGDIPTGARARLGQLGQAADSPGALFTSNLDPDELALLRRHGYRPRGIVTGSAMYHVGQAYASSQSDCEVRVLSQAYDAATELAVSRLDQELRALGAHGVVGVRLTVVRHEWGDKTIEVQVIGTAVEGPGAAPSQPWMSDLSGQEWWSLHRAGYQPVALVWGHCAWFVLTTAADEYIKQTWSNSELTHWSSALSQARHIAMTHLQGQATRAQATGVAGVHVERRLDEVRLTGAGEDPAYEREHHNLMVSIVGTAIRLRPDAPRSIPGTGYVLSLRDGQIVPASGRHADATFE